MNEPLVRYLQRSEYQFSIQATGSSDLYTPVELPPALSYPQQS